MIEPVRDRLANIRCGRQDRQAATDIVDDLVLRAFGGLEIDFDLGGVDAFCVLVEFGTSGAACHQLGLGHLHDQLLGNEADAVAFRQRDAGLEQRVDGEGAFVERRQEGARKRNGGGQRQSHTDGSARHQRSRMRKRPAQHRAIDALQTANQPSLVLVEALQAREQVVCHHRGERDGNQRGWQGWR